jgi:hypothetical protein
MRFAENPSNGPDASAPELSVEHTVVDGFADMLVQYFRGPVEVSNSARNSEDLVMSAR